MGLSVQGIHLWRPQATVFSCLGAWHREHPMLTRSPPAPPFLGEIPPWVQVASDPALCCAPESPDRVAPCAHG